MSEIRPELHLWVAYLEKKEELEEAQDRIEELKTKVKMWRNEDKKKQTACEQMGNRIAKLEAALRKIADTDPDEGTSWFHDVANRALKRGKKDE